MLDKIGKFIRCHRGQSMVEFALVVPILLLLVFGIMEGGRVLHRMIIVTEAAREGARVAIVNVGNSSISQLVKTAVNNFGPDLNTTITYKNQANGTVNAPISGGTVTVGVTSNVTIVTPLFSAIFNPNPYPVAGTATMRVE